MSVLTKKDSTVTSVLLVDDNRDSLELRSVFLTRQGFSVDTAASADDAGRMLKEQRFDLVISDREMPVMDGYDLLNVIKSDHRDIKVLVMSGEDIDKEDVFRKGALELLLKPFPNSEFLFKIQMSLDEKRRSRRFRCNSEVQCRIMDEKNKEAGAGSIYDISLEGALIETGEKIQKAKKVNLEFYTIDSPEKLVSASGEIVRQKRKDGDDSILVAVCFDGNRSLEILEHLKQFIYIG